MSKSRLTQVQTLKDRLKALQGDAEQKPSTPVTELDAGNEQAVVPHKDEKMCWKGDCVPSGRSSIVY